MSKKRPYDPGIYHNSTLGLISVSSDGYNWQTIADKNLGATQVYNFGDTLTNSNCGYFYQFGNNYGFPWDGVGVTMSQTQVDATNYGPNNYYYSSTFIKSGRDANDDWLFSNWSSVQNRDLWGGETGTVEARKGPCSNGYHIPTHSEMSDLVGKCYRLGLLTNESFISNDNPSIYLKIPYAGEVYAFRGQGSGQGAFLHCADYFLNSGTGEYYEWPYPVHEPVFNTFEWEGSNIRPFANEATIPDNTRTVLYQPS